LEKKMKKTTLFTIVPVLLLALAVSLPAARERLVDPSDSSVFPGEEYSPLPNPPEGFGKMVAGAYLADYVLESPPGFPPLPGVITLGADGTALATDTYSFGTGNPAVFGLLSPQHGSWIKTGPLTIRSKTLWFGMDETGFHTQTSWGVVDYQFADQTFQSATGTFTTRVFLTDQDPLDPDEVPLLMIEGSLTMRKINLDGE
jgi:hypothetical protein